jgi:hypothetical protein
MPAALPRPKPHTIIEMPSIPIRTDERTASPRRSIRPGAAQPAGEVGHLRAA